MRVKISVVIPVYNVEDYIVDCLDSVVNQTYDNLEIIIVDDGSTDKSGQICDIYAKRDARIKVVHKENGGLVSARKAGVVLATGEYTSYVDSDDWLELDMYESLLPEIEKDSPDVLIFASRKEYAERTEARKEYLATGIYYQDQCEDIVKRHINECDYFYTPIVTQYLWSKLFRTELIQKEQMKVDDEISMGEDFLSYACILKAKSIKVLDLQPYHYRVRQSSIVHKKIDYKKCLMLFRYLVQIKGNRDYLQPLLVQSIYYVMSLADASKVLLFPKLKKDDRVVIYGKGVMAKSLEQGICKQQLCQVVSWVDTSTIEDLLEMTECQYDYVLIAVTAQDIVKKIETLLLEKGIMQEKIMRINPADLVEENLPEDIRQILKQR